MKTFIKILHVYGTDVEDKARIKRTLEEDPSILLASFVQFSQGCFSFLVTGVEDYE